VAVTEAVGVAGPGAAALVAPQAMPCAMLELYGSESSVTAASGAADGTQCPWFGFQPQTLSLPLVRHDVERVSVLCIGAGGDKSI
jgi:hypothetical protein